MSGFTLPIVEAGGAWLAEERSVPVVSIAWSWPGGAALDPPGQEGRAALMAGLLTEGAGDLDANAFADALRDEAIELRFSADRDSFEGSLRALLPALPEAIRLARLAMTAPRFDAAAVQRLRARAIASARQNAETPRGQASRAFWEAAFPSHPMGRLAAGSAESLAAIPASGYAEAHAAQLRRGGVLAAASGAISRDELAAATAALFGALPEGAPPAIAPPGAPLPLGTRTVPVAVPQSQVIFGQAAIAVADPDWEALQVVLRILGGGGFSSRLMEAVRVQRGLTYGIGVGLDASFGQGMVVGSVATENARVAETLAVLRDEWRRMGETGPTAAELADAVAFLIGSQPLQFTDTRRIAGTLLAMQRNNRPRDWLAERPARLAALNVERTARVARRVLDPATLSVVVAGQPVGL
jgi:zinc protease